MTEMDDEYEDAPLRCGAVYLLSAPGNCYVCKRPTLMHALMGLPPICGSMMVDPMEQDEDDCVVLKEISAMPTELQPRAREASGGRWRPDFSKTVELTYWMNHCMHCDAKQGDFFVTGVNGPFFPYSDEEASAIQAERIEGPFEFVNASEGTSGALTDWRRRHEGRPDPIPVPIKRGRRKGVKPDSAG